VQQPYPTLREAKTQFRQAITALYAVQKQAATHRMEFLEHRAIFLSASGEGPAAAIVKRIKNAETESQIFKHLSWISGKIPSSPLSFLVKETDGIVQTIVGSDEIDRELFLRNFTHFSQADPTPFAQGALRRYFGEFGTNAFSSMVLQGAPLPNTLIDSEAKRIFFANLQQNTNAPAIPGRITGLELQDGYKV
jgi:hypothetical protein